MARDDPTAVIVRTVAVGRQRRCGISSTRFDAAGDDAVPSWNPSA